MKYLNHLFIITFLISAENIFSQNSVSFPVKLDATGLRTPVERTKDLKFIADILEAGKIKPVIDKVYPIEQIAEAHRYVDTGRKKGNVVITLGHSNYV